MYVKYLCRVTGTTSSDHVLLAQRLWRLTSLHSVNSAVPEDSQSNSRMTVSLSLLSSLIGVSAGSYKNSKSLYQLEDLCLNMYSYKQTLKMRGYKCLVFYPPAGIPWEILQYLPPHPNHVQEPKQKSFK